MNSISAKARTTFFRQQNVNSTLQLCLRREAVIEGVSIICCNPNFWPFQLCCWSNEHLYFLSLHAPGCFALRGWYLAPEAILSEYHIPHWNFRRDLVQ